MNGTANGPLLIIDADSLIALSANIPLPAGCGQVRLQIDGSEELIDDRHGRRSTLVTSQLPMLIGMLI